MEFWYPDPRFVELARSTPERRAAVEHAYGSKTHRKRQGNPEGVEHLKRGYNYNGVTTYEVCCGEPGSPWGRICFHSMTLYRISFSFIQEMTGLRSEPFFHLLTGEGYASPDTIKIIARIAHLFRLPMADMASIYLLSLKHQNFYQIPHLRGPFEDQDERYGQEEIQILYPKILEAWSLVTGSTRFGEYEQASPYGRPAIHFARLWQVLSRSRDYDALALMAEAVARMEPQPVVRNPHRLPPPEEVFYLSNVEESQLIGAFSTIVGLLPHDPGIQPGQWVPFFTSLGRIWRLLDRASDAWQETILNQIGAVQEEPRLQPQPDFRRDRRPRSVIRTREKLFEELGVPTPKKPSSTREEPD